MNTKHTNLNLKRYFWSTFLGLLPILLGFVLYPKLPNQIPMHWGINGQPNAYTSKLFGILFLPLFLVIVNLIVQWSFQYAKQTNLKLERVVVWLLPILSVIFQTITLSEAMGYRLNILVLTMIIVGIMLMLLGNYIPKTRQNKLIGYRINPTQVSPDTWQKTNRLGGIMLVLSGFLLVVSGIIGLWQPIVAIMSLVICVVLTVLVPLIYANRLSHHV